MNRTKSKYEEKHDSFDESRAQYPLHRIEILKKITYNVCQLFRCSSKLDIRLHISISAFNVCNESGENALKTKICIE